MANTTFTDRVTLIEASWLNDIPDAVYMGVAGGMLPTNVATTVGPEITSLNTITSGTWKGTVVEGQYGGTGVANTGKTITLNGNASIGGTFTTSGTFSTGGNFSTASTFSAGNTFSTDGAFSTSGTFATGGNFSTSSTFSAGGAFSTSGTFNTAGNFNTSSTFSTDGAFSTTGTFSTGGNFSTTGTFSTGGNFSTQGAVSFTGISSTSFAIPGAYNYTLPAGSTTLLGKDVSATLTVGFSHTPYNAGTISSGTFTPSAANGNQQYCTNGGAFTLAPPTTATSIILEVTNNSSAGAITTSGFTKVIGSFTTTDGDKFLCTITKSQTYSLLRVDALQ